MEAGVRVSLEFPDAGTCVAVVAQINGRRLELRLLDEPLPGDLGQGCALDLFLPRPEGVYHWVCTVSSPPVGERAEVEISGLPLFIQRRMGPRVGAALDAEVRREHSARRGRPYSATVADLSRGGLKLETACPLSTGDTVEVKVGLPGDPVEVVGRVVMAYPSPGHPGSSRLAHISFLEDQAGAVETISRFVAGQLRGVSSEV
jgi:hypothetical protein